MSSVKAIVSGTAASLAALGFLVATPAQAGVVVKSSGPSAGTYPVGKKLDLAGIGWAYAPAMTDLDNDGFLDIHATTGFMSRTRDKPDG